MKLLIADDHALFREGVRQTLKQLEGCAEILEAANYGEALDLSKKNPDLLLILLDLYMPGMDELFSLETFIAQVPTIPIVILSGSENLVDMQNSLDYGALGYISKSESPEVILNAIRLVLSGGIYIPPTLMLNINKPREKINNKLNVDLTRRQLEVLSLVKKGKSNKVIAKEMQISEATVKTHLTAIFKSLAVSNRTEAALATERINFL